MYLLDWVDYRLFSNFQVHPQSSRSLFWFRSYLSPYTLSNKFLYFGLHLYENVIIYQTLPTSYPTLLLSLSTSTAHIKSCSSWTHDLSGKNRVHGTKVILFYNKTVYLYHTLFISYKITGVYFTQFTIWHHTVKLRS